MEPYKRTTHEFKDLHVFPLPDRICLAVEDYESQAPIVIHLPYSKIDKIIAELTLATRAKKRKEVYDDPKSNDV